MTQLNIENSQNAEGCVTGGFVQGKGMEIFWQDGLIVDGVQTGAFVTDVLHAGLQRLEAYNETNLRTRETSIAITKIEEAILWLGARRSDRVARGVADTYQP